MSIRIGTGLELDGTALFSAGEISSIRRSMNDLLRRAETDKFWTRPKLRQTRQLPNLTCKVIMPKKQTASFIAL